MSASQSITDPQWNGALLEGKTRVGRATIQVLGINLSIRIALRQSLIDIDVFPSSHK